MHNTHTERADQLCTCLPETKTKTPHTRSHTQNLNHSHSIHKCKYTLTGHTKKQIITRPHCFSSPSVLSLFSSIIVMLYHHPESSGVWDKVMVQMTRPAILKIVVLGPKIKSKEINWISKGDNTNSSLSSIHQQVPQNCTTAEEDC